MGMIISIIEVSVFGNDDEDSIRKVISEFVI